MGRWDEAEVQYKLALKADPDNASIHYNYGILLAEMEREDEAEEQFKFTLKADPNNASIYNNYGTLLEEMGRWEEAEEQYNLALKADPNNASIHYNYGILLAEMERFEEAKKQYELALKADTNDADIHCNYGNLLAEMKLFEEAKKQYELALKADPNNIATHYNYGNLLKEMKLEGDATKLYHQAIKANPRSWRSLIYNALISENVGRNEDATKIFEYVARNENKVTDEEIIKVVNFKKEALKEKKPDEKTKVLNEIINTFLEKRENLFKEIDINESKFKKFVDYERSIPEDFFSFLSILRKWNSYTPIFPSVKDDNKGGDYFLFHCGKGIVIDPGFKFIENFYQEGFKVADIDAVLITHAHNDHTADFESILTLVHQHNAAIKKAVREEMKGEDDTDKMKKEIKRRLDEKGKKIDLFMNLGTFKKFSGWLNLKDSNEINPTFRRCL
jgi:Tfp pilus assembly protein PilF